MKKLLQRNVTHGHIILTLTVFAAVYLLFFFPFAYFRHDDWLMIGNSLFQEKDWTFCLKPVLFYGNGFGIWFFRPLFKLLMGLFFSLFGYHYYPFLVFHLVCTLGALWLGYRIVALATAKETSGFLFVLLFALTLPLSFGSLVWAGEGMMNCPQVLALALNTYGILLAAKSGRTGVRITWICFSVFVFVLALGLKESSVFHAAFLFAFVLSEPPFRTLTSKSKTALLAPFMVISAIYLVYRLIFLPLLPDYKPQFTTHLFNESLAIVVATLSFCPVVILLGARIAREFSWNAGLAKLKGRWLYGPFLAVSIAPYIGHEFFSPGWLLLPGFFFLLLFNLTPWEFRHPKKVIAWASTLALVLSGPLFLYRLHQLHWWQWKKPQMEIVEQIQSRTDALTRALVIRECSKDKNPGLSFRRVIGGDSSLKLLWRLVHGTYIPIHWQRCQPHASAPVPPNSVVLEWRFPKIISIP